MKVIRRIRFPGKAALALAVVLLTALALIALAAACGGGEEEEGTATPGATGTAKPTGTAAATGTAKPTPAASPGAVGPGVTDTEIILGHHNTLSGTTGAAYKIVTDSFQAYLKYVNEEEGGACGRKIVLKVENDQGTEVGALEAVRKLVEKEKVLAVVASLGNQTASLEYMTEKGVPYVLSYDVRNEVAKQYEKYPWSTQMVPSTYTVGRNMAQYITEELPGKKVAILYPASAAGDEGVQGVRDGLDPSINEIVAEQSIELLAVDLRAPVSRLKESEADVVCLFTSIPQTVQAAKMADRLGWEPAWVAHYVMADPIVFLYAPGDLLEGMITFHAFKMHDSDDPAVVRHREIMEKYGGPKPGIFSILSQTAVQITVETLRRTCDNLTREGFMQANLSLDHWTSDLLYPGMTVSTSETDRRFLQGGPGIVVRMVDGQPKWTLLREKAYAFYEEGEQ
jgi:branched-chain amino acid transport system substrate-binding protein